MQSALERLGDAGLRVESRGVEMAFDFALYSCYGASVLSNSLTKSKDDYFYFQVLLMPLSY